MRNQKLNKIRDVVGDHHVYLILDETTDVKEQLVLNELVGKLDGAYSKPMLLTTKFLAAAKMLTTLEWSYTLRSVMACADRSG